MAYIAEIEGDEPVTVSDAKDHLRINTCDEDELIGRMIVSARQWAETYMEKAIVEQTITAYYDKLEQVMALPLGGATDVTEIRYLDGDKVQQTLTTGFRLIRGTPNKVYISVVPENEPEIASVEIEYEAGGSVSERVSSGILMMVGDLYENREGQQLGQKFESNPTLTSLLTPLREFGL
jgi:uncharacterized phiE125 gp8 family phage protein